MPVFFSQRQKLSLVVSYLAILFSPPIFHGGWSLASLDLTAVDRHENATANNECPHPERDTDAYKRTPEMDWSETTQILPNSLFYLGDMFGVATSRKVGKFFNWRKIVPLALFLGSALSALTLWVVRYLPIFLAMRFASGIFQGYALSGLYVTMSFGVPDKSRLWTMRGLFGAYFTGRAISFLSVGLVLGMNWNRSITFYLFACCGVALAGSFMATTEGVTEMTNSTRLSATPWRAVLKSEPVRVLCFATAGHTWIVSLFTSSLPKFLQECLVLSQPQNGFVMGLFLLCIAITIISHGFLEDFHTFSNGQHDAIRKRLYFTLASFVPPLFFILAVDNSCNANLSCWLLIMGGSCLGFFYSTVVQNAQELSPRYEFNLLCFAFTFGLLFAAISPLVASFLAPNHFHDEWRKVTWVTFLFVNGMSSFFLFSCSVKREVWDNIKALRLLPPRKIK